MDLECLPYGKTRYFSKIILDYLDEAENLRPFYHRFPNLESFRAQIDEKQKSYPDTTRRQISKLIQKQYQKIEVGEATMSNIQLLNDSNTFTVVTGHQLNLFTGPLYFIYKIVSTINLCRDLADRFPEYHFVPVYWMASEDHDFEEINYFNFRGQKMRWNKEASGAVGRMDTEGLEEVYQVFQSQLGKSERADHLLELFRQSYLEHGNLTEATRFLAHRLFGEHGLVIVDGDDIGLKRLLIPYMEKEFAEKISFNAVSATIKRLAEPDLDYHVQVNPREINYFYLTEGVRERILEDKDGFVINNTDIRFSREALQTEITNHPERFSPNVITRPLFQEVVLPNLCYIGGGGEIAYWLQLKTSFEAQQVPFPILLLRNSALMISRKQYKKLQKLNLSLEDIFMKQSSFINKKIREISNINIDLSSQKQFLKEHFESMYEIAEQTDKSFLGAVKAQEVKQLKGIDRLEKRLLKAQRRKLKDHVIRMTDIQNQLFPNQSLQERVLNFSEIYLEYGPGLIEDLLAHLQPLSLEFAVIKY